MKFPYPGALTALQYFTSAAGVLLFGQLKFLEHDRLDLWTMWRFLPAAFIFYLSSSQIASFSSMPMLIPSLFSDQLFPSSYAIGETLYLHQPWPTMKTWMSLGTIFGGSVLYVLTDYQFTLTAYSWALRISSHVVMTIGLNTWGLVLYNNLEAFLLFPFELMKLQMSQIGTRLLLYFRSLSCLFGLAISFFGFSCRRAISATGFTVLGIVNKLLTVVINLLIWDKHSTLVGYTGQSTSKKPNDVKEQTKSQGSEEEQEKLIELQKNVNETNTVEKEVVGSEVRQEGGNYSFLFFKILVLLNPLNCNVKNFIMCLIVMVVWCTTGWIFLLLFSGNLLLGSRIYTL
ncbi:hypothetical protein MKW92_020859 [Papaver armeniacum]|nr:hypothetical protein MKW92_020859 [Papaver armeniacum]